MTLEEIKAQVGFNNIPHIKLRSEDALGEKASAGWLLKWNLADKGVWIKSAGKILYYMWDSYAEIIASALAADLGIKNVLVYRPCIIKVDGEIILGNMSRDYNVPGYKEITIQKIKDSRMFGGESYFGENGYNKLISRIQEKFKLDIREYLEDMLLLDSIILNSDRELWNISILTDSNYNGRTCVIYDNGSSLGLTGYNTGRYDPFNRVKSEPFDTLHDDQIKYIRNERVYGNPVYRENGQLDLTNSLPRTARIIYIIKNEFTKENNKYNILNPLDTEQIVYVETLIQNRFEKVILEKGWIT